MLDIYSWSKYLKLVASENKIKSPENHNLNMYYIKILIQLLPHLSKISSLLLSFQYSWYFSFRKEVNSLPFWVYIYIYNIWTCSSSGHHLLSYKTLEKLILSLSLNFSFSKMSETRSSMLKALKRILNNTSLVLDQYYM